jgi:hypothetical protein
VDQSGRCLGRAAGGYVSVAEVEVVRLIEHCWILSEEEEEGCRCFSLQAALALLCRAEAFVRPARVEDESVVLDGICEDILIVLSMVLQLQALLAEWQAYSVSSRCKSRRQRRLMIEEAG